MAKAQLTVGMTIDGFVMEERLHRGGMASIWRVSHADIAFPIIMKLPFLDFEGDLSLLVGFEVEQMIMAELSGPHVPKWIANGDFAVQPYIVMEYVAGPTAPRGSLGQTEAYDHVAREIRHQIQARQDVAVARTACALEEQAEVGNVVVAAVLKTVGVLFGLYRLNADVAANRYSRHISFNV